MIKVSVFRWVPPFAQGFVRDLRVRWALEEAGIPYQERLIGLDDKSSPGYRAIQPFAQIPAFEEDGKSLFESGAIVLHIAERSTALAPTDSHARARVTTWVIAALNSVEPFVANLAEIDVFHPKADWAASRRPLVVKALTERLTELEAYLGKREFLEDRFTAGDLIMTTVLRDVPEGMLADLPVLSAYRARCEARPAFKKALADQLATFAKHEPPAT